MELRLFKKAEKLIDEISGSEMVIKNIDELLELVRSEESFIEVIAHEMSEPNQFAKKRVLGIDKKTLGIIAEKIKEIENNSIKENQDKFKKLK